MKLNYKEFGNRHEHTLVILHGLLGSLDNWQSLAKRFSTQYHVITVDQRNHGKSPHHPSMSYEILAHDLLEFLDDLKLDSVVLLGHSMGGKVCMQFALHHPGRVEKMIIVDVAPKAYARGHDHIFAALFAVDLEKINARNDARNMMKKYIPQEAVMQFLLKNLKRSSKGTWSWKANITILHQFYNEISGPIQCDWPFNNPVLFIKGALSNYISDEDEANIANIFPKSTLISIPNTGHWVHAEAPDEVFKLVSQFINSNNNC